MNRKARRAAARQEQQEAKRYSKEESTRETKRLHAKSKKILQRKKQLMKEATERFEQGKGVAASIKLTFPSEER